MNLVFENLYLRAYDWLSEDLRTRESFDAFKQDRNAVLYKGCWVHGAFHVSQIDSQTWAVGVELRQVSCVDMNPLVYYDWVFSVQKQQGGVFVIVSLKLYPTGSGNG